MVVGAPREQKRADRRDANHKGKVVAAEDLLTQALPVQVCRSVPVRTQADEVASLDS
ncbi:hypothetical protein [Acidipila sp. EB88]|uniref:hypothetical protein n=1 Tax=Acidipila sp. EB88 TaxID=2305226 RepID=UPI0013157DD7|nr:hypothetical protein [Acidipila sp. EB88]